MYDLLPHTQQMRQLLLYRSKLNLTELQNKYATEFTTLTSPKRSRALQSPLVQIHCYIRPISAGLFTYFTLPLTTIRIPLSKIKTVPQVTFSPSLLHPLIYCHSPCFPITSAEASTECFFM